MRFGVTADSQKMIAEERRQSRQIVAPGSEDLIAIPPATVTYLNTPNEVGQNASVFILGLHDPFDSRIARVLAFP